MENDEESREPHDKNEIYKGRVAKALFWLQCAWKLACSIIRMGGVRKLGMPRWR
jgi:hypothetical protein